MLEQIPVSRRSHHTTAIIASALVALTLAGCTAGDSTAEPTDTASAAPSATPLAPGADAPGSEAYELPFASDDAARDAATAHYEAYLATSIAILQDGGDNPERLQPLVTDEVYANELLGFERAQSEGFRFEGAPELLDTTFIERTLDESTGVESVTITACISRETIEVVYDDGERVTIPGAAPRYARNIVIDFTANGPLFAEDGEPDPSVEC